MAWSMDCGMSGSMLGNASGRYSGSFGGVGGNAGAEWVVKVGHMRTRLLNSAMPILFLGSTSKMRPKMVFNSEDNGNIVLRNFGFARYARKVESSMEALFQGFLPQVRFTRMIPRLQMSFGAEA